jgi:2-C-methyl-D-erythritol 4-phosphate cytidylyltransferase
VLAWTLEAALACPAIRWIGVVGQPEDAEAIGAIVAAAQPDRPVEWILGGETRQESVSRGLEALPAEAEAVLIHDGARCLVEPALLAACVTALEQAMLEGAGLVAATPVTDTIKEVEDGTILATPDRSRLWAAQTPQGFGVAQLRQAHGEAIAQGWSVTDDAALFERLGLPVRVLEAPPSNIKLTTSFDLTIAAAVLAERFSGAAPGSPGPALPQP